MGGEMGGEMGREMGEERGEEKVMKQVNNTSTLLTEIWESLSHFNINPFKPDPCCILQSTFPTSCSFTSACRI